MVLKCRNCNLISVQRWKIRWQRKRELHLVLLLIFLNAKPIYIHHGPMPNQNCDLVCESSAVASVPSNLTVKRSKPSRGKFIFFLLGRCRPSIGFRENTFRERRLFFHFRIFGIFESKEGDKIEDNDKGHVQRRSNVIKLFFLRREMMTIETGITTWPAPICKGF